MTLEHKVLIVSVSHDPAGLKDPSTTNKRIDSFIDALRRVTRQGNAIVVFDPQVPSEPCNCDQNRRKHCNCKDKNKCTCPHLKCDTCKLVARIDTEKYAADLTALYATHTTNLTALSTTFITAQALHADFTRDTKAPATVFRRIWRMRGDCPRDCRGYLHLGCGHARPWTRAPTLETYLEFRLMKQRVAVEEAWEGFKGEVGRRGLFEGVVVGLPRVVEEGVAVG